MKNTIIYDTVSGSRSDFRRFAAYRAGRESGSGIAEKYLIMEALRRKMESMKGTEFIMTVPFRSGRGTGDSNG